MCAVCAVRRASLDPRHPECSRHSLLDTALYLAGHGCLVLLLLLFFLLGSNFTPYLLELSLNAVVSLPGVRDLTPSFRIIVTSVPRAMIMVIMAASVVSLLAAFTAPRFLKPAPTPGRRHGEKGLEPRIHGFAEKGCELELELPIQDQGQC